MNRFHHLHTQVIHTVGIWALQGYLAHKKPPPSRTLQWDRT